jgi:cell division GTPase FtsZ
MAMTSECRTATDVRHRINAPNSQPRAITVVGLGKGGGATAERIGKLDLRNLRILTPDSARETDGATEEFARTLEGSDMIFVVAQAGDALALAPLIGQIGRRAGKLVTAIVIADADASADAELNVLRKSVGMLVIASDESYVVGMLEALGA